MTRPRSPRDPPISKAPHTAFCRYGPGRARARAVHWLASILLTAPATLPGCLDAEPTVDPLRIPWHQLNQRHGSSPGDRPSAPSAAAEVAGAERDVEMGDGAARREELRALHSPLEAPTSGLRSVPVNTCSVSNCHAEISAGPEIHSRIAATTCTRCHVPEGEPEEHGFRIVDTDGGICRVCHVPHETTGTGHAPFRELRCLACHNPHESVETKLLGELDGGARLCARCHEATHEAVTHGPYAQGRCLSCHAGHESEFTALTRQSSAALCLDCHDEEIAVAGRVRPVPDMAALLRTSRFAHGPIRDGDCGSCHDAHAAPHGNLLRKPYPRDFYQAWDPSHYALCFQCHPTELATEARTSTKTGFRDGDRNLHHLHVNREKGRSCRACHEVHATDLPFQLRASVPFGEWELRIIYEPRPDGGVCLAGCHQEEEYDRTRSPTP